MSDGNGAATREDILKLADAPVTVEWLEVPELGDGKGVYLKLLRGFERDQFQASCLIESGDGSTRTNTNNISARFATFVLCDQDGNRLFKQDDSASLGDLPSSMLDRIWKRGQVMNRLGTLSGDPVTVDDAAKNSSDEASG